MKVLVLTLSFGSGHVQAAHTVALEVKRQAPDAEVLVIDALDGCHFLFRAGYVWPYWAMVRHAPALWDRFFARRTKRMVRHTAPQWAFQHGCPQVFKTIADFEPDTIVASEVAACEMAAIAKRQGLTRARLVNVITDFEAEPVWVKPEVDAYAVPDQHVRDQLCGWGAPAERVTICGIPTDAAFGTRHNENETRDRFGINDDVPIVLIMGGGVGPTRMDEVAAKLCREGKAVHVIAATGHDKRVGRRLARLSPSPSASLSVLSWTDDIPALMQAASLLVTKPGGLTTAEAAMCALPIVMFDAIPGPERRNAARFVESSAGVLTNGPRETASTVLNLLRDASALHRMSSCAKRLARPDAATAIAQLALDYNAPAQELARRMTA